MMRCLKIFFLVIVSFMMVPVGKAQVIDSMMDLYRDNFPQEKIYVHFDKSYYNPGELIWFKAYLMAGSSRSAISKNLYAEFIDEKGVVLQHIVAPVLESSAASAFEIPSSFKGQVLHFRAYTTWMLNFDTTFLYRKDIRILNRAPVASAVISNPPATTSGVAFRNAPIANQTTVTFFPEGGDLVTSLESQLAFKANDRYGQPVKITGFVRNAAGKKIIDFASVHNGLGVFAFTPEAGETYTAVWRDSTKKDNTTALPPAKKSGVVLSVKKQTTGVQFTVKRTEETDEPSKQFVVIAHMHQQMVYKAKVNLSQKNSAGGTIPVDDFPAGIMQVTVFDANSRPLAERIVFVNNNNYVFDAYFRTLSKNMAKRGKNVIEIEIPDTLSANLSISITDAAAHVPAENQDNIYSRLLLTEDLKGFITRPGYYFSSYADSVNRHLDLVMLTHGWRRFNWEHLASGTTPELKFLPDNYITLQGTVIGLAPGKVAAAGDLNLFMELKDSTRQFLSATLTGGKFQLPNMLFYDTARIYYQLNNKRIAAGGDLLLKVDNGLWKGYPHVEVQPALVEPAPDQAVAALNQDISNKTISLEGARNIKMKTLQEVIVSADRRSATQKLDENYTSGLFRGGDGYSFDLTNDMVARSSNNIFMYLQGRVAGLIISNSMGTPTLSWRGSTPDLYLNEMRTDAQALSSLSMADVAYVKVMRPPFMGGAGGGAGGAIAIYTRKGNERQDENFKGLSRITVSGYTPVKEFYSPNYAQPNVLHDLDDLRTTLYWSPFILLDRDKRKAIITFYNNDISKKLRVIIEGVNEVGQLTRVEEFIQ